jgi:hypothetical protein
MWHTLLERNDICGGPVMVSHLTMSSCCTDEKARSVNAVTDKHAHLDSLPVLEAVLNRVNMEPKFKVWHRCIHTDVGRSQHMEMTHAVV